MRSIVLLLTLALATPALAGPRGADDPDREPRPGPVDVHGEARLRVDALRPFALDVLGTGADRSWWLSSRIRVGVDLKPTDDVTVAFELEALTGAFAGQWTSVGTSIERPFRVSRSSVEELLHVLPRKLGVRVSKPTYSVTAGVQTFGWGSGMLSNAGDGDPIFGDAMQGGVVLRVGGAATPWRPDASRGLARGLVFFGAFDFVIRDDTAFLYRGDLASSGVGGVRLVGRRGEFGVLASARFQSDRVDPYHAAERRPSLFALPIDAYARWRFLPEDGPVHLTLEGEVAAVHGRTTRTYGEETVDGARIHSFGALARVRLDVDPVRLTTQLEVGYASGDADPRDGVARAFTMNSDHNVGLILFEQVLPLLTARAVDRVADPELSGTPAAGLRHGVAQGGVSNAVYVFPTVRIRPVHTLDVRLGWVLAVAPVQPVDLYATAANGGWSKGWGSGRLYGNEIDAGLHWTLLAPSPVRVGVKLGVEGGVFLPGSAFDSLDLGVPATVRGHLAFTW